MKEILSTFETWLSGVTLATFVALASAFAVFTVIYFLIRHERRLIRNNVWLWYLEAVLLPLAVIGVTSLIVSVVPMQASTRLRAEQIGDSVLWLVIAFLGVQALDIFVWRGFFRKKFNVDPPALLTGMTAFGLYLLALFAILTFVFQLPMTGLVVSSGVVMGVVGLAMQGSLSDLVAGIAITIERPFKIGDWVELDDGTLGEVVDINWRATQIQSWNSSLYILPNSRVSNARVHNYNMPDKRYGYWFYVHVPSTVPPVLVRRVLLEAAVFSDKVLDDPPPVVRINSAGGSYKYMVFVHFESYPLYFSGVDDVLMHVWLECARYGIVPSAVTTEIIMRKGVAEEIQSPPPEELFKEVELFKGLDLVNRRNLLAAMKVVTKPMASEIVHQGDVGDSLFLVSSGMVSVKISIDGGPEKEVAKLGAGDFFGEMSLLAGDLRAATVTAHTDCQLLELDKTALKPVFDHYPELMEQMALVVSQRQIANQQWALSVNENDVASRLQDFAKNLLSKMKTIFA